VLKSNEHAVLILSDPRKVPGHCLVIPKRHVDQPWELTAEELQDIFELVWEAEQKLIAAGLGDGVDVRQNYRPFLSQSKLKVNHVHFHVIPRALNDYVYQISEKYDTELFADLDPKEAQEVTKILS
jgi:diadenosine tetraphosphate (Ap4A) HIT family hydrolase